MTKAERLKALNQKIDDVVKPVPRRIATKILLWMFIKGFKIKSYFKDSVGLARYWYIFVALPLFLFGYILDVLINQTVGKEFFPSAFKFGTLTATLWRVKKLGAGTRGFLFAIQICEVLGDYDPGHC